MPKATASPLTEKERQQVERFFGDPTIFPAIFRSWLVAYIEANPPLLPISQITGFSQFTAKYATVQSVTGENTTSTTYTNLTTTGPELTGLPDGLYLVLHGCVSHTSVAGSQARQSISVNGVTAVDDDATQCGVANNQSVMTAVIKTLDAGDNTILCKYRCEGGAAGEFSYRFLIALKYANA